MLKLICNELAYGIAVVNERLPVVLDLLGDAVLLQDVDDADEDQQVFAAMVLSRNSAPHVVQAGLVVKVEVLEDFAVDSDTVGGKKVSHEVPFCHQSTFFQFIEKYKIV